MVEQGWNYLYYSTFNSYDYYKSYVARHKEDYAEAFNYFTKILLNENGTCNVLDLVYKGNEDFPEFYKGSVDRIQNFYAFYVTQAHFSAILYSAAETFQKNSTNTTEGEVIKTRFLEWRAEAKAEKKAIQDLRTGHLWKAQVNKQNFVTRASDNFWANLGVNIKHVS